MNLKYLGKEILLDVLAGLPYTGAIARQWDSIESDKRFKKIEQDIAKIWDFISKNPKLPLEDSLLKLMRFIGNNELAADFNFRRAESCMALLKQINIKSKLGQANDPIIDCEECVEIINNEEELKLVVYELEKENLVHKLTDLKSPLGFRAIAPKEYFFCKTDSIFQKWNPKHDAKEIVELLIKSGEDSVTIEKLDARLQWGPRRLNSAIAYLDLKGLIRHDHELGGVKYVVPWIRLTEEAYFFVENKQ